MKQGLQRFVLDTVAPLNQLIGDAWMRGGLAVFLAAMRHFANLLANSATLCSTCASTIRMRTGSEFPPEFRLPGDGV
jgi:hypothetical protein